MVHGVCLIPGCQQSLGLAMWPLWLAFMRMSVQLQKVKMEKSSDIVAVKVSRIRINTHYMYIATFN